MAIIESEFHTTIPKAIAKTVQFTDKRKEYGFDVYRMDDSTRFILFEDQVFIFLIENESKEFFISSNSEFNVILNSKDRNTFTVDFQTDHT